MRSNVHQRHLMAAFSGQWKWLEVEMNMKAYRFQCSLYICESSADFFLFFSSLWKHCRRDKKCFCWCAMTARGWEQRMHQPVCGQHTVVLMSLVKTLWTQNECLSERKICIRPNDRLHLSSDSDVIFNCKCSVTLSAIHQMLSPWVRWWVRWWVYYSAHYYYCLLRSIRMCLCAARRTSHVENEMLA